ncbi:MerR family transcriptional regulator [Candidatus Berkiella aquae]|uniref:HTH-type transcriptional activator mta n=1 Tax=Candidatus Berkiella aquae TaxID=295108 RepID=A0A0Q9YD26_9GAMM|nr:MerR family transcriptional regulator [Candidatus Berkiella aquae]MCS5709904.1 MerR family transcriptional regulator [Candidatus Berkiella aquae]
MSRWYVKELSKLTQVSVQTLHHYDRIGLLKPSLRLANGYRLYSEKDLLTLQRIIALKFFGFELAQIKTLLSTDVGMMEHFSVQSKLLEQKATALFEASQTLKNILVNCGQDESIPWEKMIQLIEVYRMTQQLEQTWVGKILTPVELKEYAIFEHELNKRLTISEIQSFEQQWADIIFEIKTNLHNDPNSEIGIALGKRCMDWVNAYYGKKHVALRNAIWEKGLKSGQAEETNGLSVEGSIWLDKAISAYYRDRILQLLKQIETLPHLTLIKQWDELLMDMHGDEPNPQNEIIDEIMQANTTSQLIKSWLKKYSKVAL